jgi:hypothetical protein
VSFPCKKRGDLFYSNPSIGLVKSSPIKSNTAPSSRVIFHRRTSNRPFLPRRIEVKEAVPPAAGGNRKRQRVWFFGPQMGPCTRLVLRAVLRTDAEQAVAHMYEGSTVRTF